MSNYESRLERLEQEIAAPTDISGVVVYLDDSDERPADRMTVRGQCFDRGADEDVEDFLRRVLDSLGLVDRNVTDVRYVGSDGNGSPRFPDAHELS